MVKLPTNLLLNGFRPLGGRQASGFDGIRSRTKCVRTHVAYGGGLTSGLGSGGGGGIPDVTRTNTTGKTPANLIGNVQLSPRKRAGPANERPRAVIIGRLRLKEPQDTLRAVGGPCGNKAPVGFTQRLW